MRIIAGDWRKRPLVAPEGQTTRPTADRTRETLFSMLTSRLGSFDDLRVADLYAGSGALGFEALSRGAKEVVFVETDVPARRAIEANSVALGCTEQKRVLATSAEHLPSVPPFDLIFADPPYGSRRLACPRRLAGDRNRARRGDRCRPVRKGRRTRHRASADHAAAAGGNPNLIRSS
jgi:16S rRNA (guanine(966)-N(2))-methyltransferase RsmD